MNRLDWFIIWIVCYYAFYLTFQTRLIVIWTISAKESSTRYEYLFNLFCFDHGSFNLFLKISTNTARILGETIQYIWWAREHLGCSKAAAHTSNR